MVELHTKWLALGLGRDARLTDWAYTGMAMVWAYGVEGAGTLDDTAVRDWLLAQETIPHIVGDGYWWGEDIFAVSNYLIRPEPISEFHDGKHIIMEWVDVGEWFDEEGTALAVKWLEHYGMMYYQR